MRPGANLVIVRVPADGRIKLFNFAGATHLVADVVATFAPAADTTAAGRLLPLAAPLRLLDTRGGPPLAGPGVRTTSFGALDAATPGNLRGLVLNLTATEPTSSTYLTAFPADGGVPLASNVNVTARSVDPEPRRREAVDVRRAVRVQPRGQRALPVRRRRPGAGVSGSVTSPRRHPVLAYRNRFGGRSPHCRAGSRAKRGWDR